MNRESPQKVALVTGGSGGIGRAIALQLSAQGFFVVMTSRTETDLAEQAGFRSVLIDHSQPHTAAQLAEDVAAHEGRIDVVVNSAAQRHNELIENFDAQRVIASLVLNLASPLLITGALIPLFGTAGGSVINISSRLGTVGIPGVSAYAAAKGGLNAFTRAAAVELAERNIRVNTVAPGMTQTAMIEGWLQTHDDPEAALEDSLATIPLGRLAQTGDIAAVVGFLASEKAAYLTGALIPVDGGYTAA